MNKVELIGRITKDPEIKSTSNQTPFCQFTLAVDRRFKDSNGNRQADFINCLAWKQTAEFITKYFKKGNRIGVIGSIQTRSYDKDGQKVFLTEVVIDEAEFVENNAKINGNEENASINGNEKPTSDENSANNVRQENTSDIPGELPFEI